MIVDREVAVGVQVDEARSDHGVVGVDDARGVPGCRADRDDPIAVDDDVRRDRLAT
jgi:hypothetical protein